MGLRAIGDGRLNPIQLVDLLFIRTPHPLFGRAWYNGFDPKVRAASGQYRRELMSRGWKPPSTCLACGQSEGAVDSHVEDYSRPFDPAKYIPLCFRCHLFAIHMRHRYPEE